MVLEVDSEKRISANELCLCIKNNCSFNTVAWTWQIDSQMESNPDVSPIISMIGALDPVVMTDPMTIETSSYSIKKVYGLM